MRQVGRRSIAALDALNFSPACSGLASPPTRITSPSTGRRFLTTLAPCGLLSVLTAYLPRCGCDVYGGLMSKPIAWWGVLVSRKKNNAMQSSGFKVKNCLGGALRLSQ
jgi:hypothetical protein